MPETKRPLKVFLCHAHSDAAAVHTLYSRLRREGVDVWLDKEKLLPGADWELEIRKAVRETDVVVVCLSKQFNQAGFRQKEVRIALETAMEQPEGEIFIIPARLEECDNLESLKKWHWVDLFETDGYQKLIRALRARADRIGTTLRIRRGGKSVTSPTESREHEKTALPLASGANPDDVTSDNRILAKTQEISEKDPREKQFEALQPKVAGQRTKKQNKPNTAVIIALIGLTGTIIAAFLSSPLIGELFAPVLVPTASATTTSGPTSTFTLHPDAVGPIQTLTALAGAVDILEQANMTQPVHQTLTSVARTIEILGQTATKAAETPTPTLIIIPSPKVLGESIQVFDERSSSTNGCWEQETNGSTALQPSEGFRRRVDGNWGFAIENIRTADEFVQTDFSLCFDITQVKSIAINAGILRLDLQRDYPEIKDPGKEIGFFIESTNGQRREYTIWIDKEESMHLRVREDGDITFDDIVSIVDPEILKIRGSFPRSYAEFPIQFFFEVDNNGLDIVYLKQGLVQQSVSLDAMDPNQMIIIQGTVRPTLGNIQKLGLIGYGGETQVVLWPLAFLDSN